MTSQKSSVSLSSLLPSDWEGYLSFLKLKHGIAGLQDSRESIEQQGYYIVFVQEMTDALLKTILVAHRQAFTEKHIKSQLVLFCTDVTDSALREFCCSLGQPGVIVIDGTSSKTAAILLRGATAFVMPLYQGSLRSLFADALAFEIPIVTMNQGEVQETIGHAAYFLERIEAGEIERAFMKLENSTQLRASIQHAAREFLRQEAALQH